MVLGDVCGVMESAAEKIVSKNVNMRDDRRKNLNKKTIIVNTLIEQIE